MSWYNVTDPKELVGKTIITVRGLDIESRDDILFITENESYRISHHQDCCESCYIVAIDGVKDLDGAKVISFSEDTIDAPHWYNFNYEPDSYTWTVYTLVTDKGETKIHWLGESNGYYSESPTFEKL